MATYEYTVKGKYWLNTISCTSGGRGSYGLTNTLVSSVRGQHRTGTQTWLTRLHGQSALLNAANTSSRGTFAVVNSFPRAWTPASGLPQPGPLVQRGTYGIVQGKVSSIHGKYRVGILPALTTDRGQYRLGSPVISTVRGHYRVGTLIVGPTIANPSSSRGYYRLAYTTYTRTGLGKFRLAQVNWSPSRLGTFGIKNTIPRSNVGKYGINNNFSIDREGWYRIQGTAGYNCYVGQDALPDFTLPPTAFSAALPFNVAQALPTAGTKLVYVAVRKVNSYGLESQNVKPTIIRLTSAGALLHPILAPAAVLVIPNSATAATVLAQYANYATDLNKATLWKGWVSLSLIDITTAPTFTQAVSGQNLSKSLSGLSAGTWNIALALFRATDSNQSPLLEDTFVIPTTPPEPVPVAGGYSIPD